MIWHSEGMGKSISRALPYPRWTGEGMKRCPSCGVEKPEKEFGRCRASRDGLQFYCKSCHRVYERQYRRRREEEIIRAYGGRCECCGVGELDFLVLAETAEANPGPSGLRRAPLYSLRWVGTDLRDMDGVEGRLMEYGGGEFPEALAHWQARRERLRRSLGGYRVLCLNCLGAEVRLGSCPHVKAVPLPPAPPAV